MITHKVLQEKDIIWLAGLFEGEATFYPQTNKYPAGLSIQMTDEDVIQKVCRLIGTKYCSPSKQEDHHKQSYKTTLRGKPAVHLMLSLLPYMGIRRSQKIEECIKSYSIKQVGKLSDIQKATIILRYMKGEKPKEIAKDFPVSFWRVYQIVRGL